MSINRKTAEIAVFGITLALISVSAIASAEFGSSASQIAAESSIEVQESERVVPQRSQSYEEDAAATEEVRVKIPLAAAAEVAEVADFPKHFYEEELIEVLRSVGFEESTLRKAWAVAMKESTGNPLAHNGNSSTGDNSYGLFQINMIGKLGVARMEKYGLSSYEDLFDPYVNARIAFEMSRQGTNWVPWGIGPDAYNGGTTGSYHTWYKEYPGGK